jgi:hypothetical protein
LAPARLLRPRSKAGEHGARPADWDHELGYIGGLAQSEEKEAGRARKRAVRLLVGLAARAGPRGEGTDRSQARPK